jgi:hypothetical protein
VASIFRDKESLRAELDLAPEATPR